MIKQILKPLYLDPDLPLPNVNLLQKNLGSYKLLRLLSTLNRRQDPRCRTAAICNASGTAVWPNIFQLSQQHTHTHLCIIYYTI